MFPRLVRLLGAGFLVLIFPLPSTAKAPGASSVNSDYVAALAAADHFLQAWQSGDAGNGIALLTERAKKGMNPDDLDKLFSASDPSGYEIDRGKRVRRGRYEFPVVMLNRAANKLHRKFSTLVIANTSNNDWAVDKLP